MDIDETCPICFWYSKAVKGNRSQVNRHLKEYAVKDDPKGHPRMGTVEFEELMASRRCFTASRDKHEQARTRKARNQRYRNNHPELKRTIRVKSQQKSASRGLPSRQKTMTPQSRIDEAFAKLRTLDLPEPPDIANYPSPNFARLVFRYLPSDQWHKGYTRAKLDAYNRRIPGPDTSIVDAHHYELLLKVPECDKTKLKVAWAEWRRLGEYRNGESQRKDWFCTSADLGRRWILYQSIKEWRASTRGPRRAFEAEWRATALREMEDQPDWEMWSDVTEMLEEPVAEAVRRIAGVHNRDYFNPGHPDEFLGSRCYAV